MTDAPPPPNPADSDPQIPTNVQPPAPPTAKAGGLALASLIVGGVAFLFGLIPYFGVLLAVTAIVVAIIALVKKQTPQWMPFVGGGAAIIALIAGLVITSVVASGYRAPSATPPVTQPQAEETTAAQESPEAESTPTPTTVPLTLGQEQAVGKAQSYLDFQAFSRTGLIGQLEFESFTTEDATFAVDYLAVDWNDQAAKKAQSYLDYQNFSRQGLIDQLVFEGFSQAEAEFGVAAVGY